jgi:glycosyltransferase involved in cell wall biosynthesis
MNVLFICDEYPPGLNGGIGSITQSLAREMALQGHQVFVVGLYSYEYGQSDFEEDNGVKVWRLRYGFKLPNIKKIYAAQRRLPNFLKQCLFAHSDFAKFVHFIEHLIIQYKIDIIEQPDWNTFAYLIGLKNPILPKLKVPLIIKSHGSHTYLSVENSLPINHKWSAIDKSLFNRADASSFVSNYCFEQNNKVFTIKKPIKILYNSIAYIKPTNPITREQDLVFYSGSITKVKGIYSLMHAWNLVIDKHPNARLIVFGKGDIQSVRNLLNQNSLKSVQFMGHQAKELLIEYLEKCTLSVFPSYSETFGLSAVESMICACPTIFTKRSCGPEIIDNGAEGILVDPDNIEEIAEKILLLLDNKQLRQQIGTKGQGKVMKTYNLSKSVIDHIDFYQQVINQFNNKL